MVKSAVVLSGVPKSLASGLEKHAIPILKAIYKVFPDGEQYLRFEDVKESVVVVQSLYPDQDRRLVELYLALEALRGLGAEVSVLLLYAAYARQDKRFLRGEPISVRALYSPLSTLGCRKLIVIDAHSPKAFSELGIDFENVIPHAYLAKKAGIEVDYVLAPDKGALHRAECLAKELGIPYDNLEKFRDRITGEISVKEKKLDVKGLRVAIVDDIVSTGGTLAKAVEALYKAGASKVIAIVTHALLVGSAIDKIERSGLDRLVTANTIGRDSSPKWLIEVDISDLVSKYFAS